MFERSRGNAAKAYLFSVLTAAIATLARFAVDPIAHEKDPFLFFAFAVVIAALYGGFRAGVTATLLGILAGDFFFVEPRYTLFIHDSFGDSTMLVLFAALGTALSIIVERLNRAKERIRKSSEELAGANTVLEANRRDLERANERFRMATEAADEAIWELDIETQTATWSDLYARSFGRSPADSSKEWWVDHLHPEDRARVEASFDRALSGDACSWTCEYRMLNAAGAWVDVYDRASIARGPDGKPLRAIGAILDVTETRRAQEELQRRTAELARSNEDLQRFAFVVSHDLQAPLGMIEEHCRQLTAAKPGEEPDRPIRPILDGVRKMRTIMHDLLEFARTGQPAPEMRTDCSAILDLTLQHLQPAIRETGASIVADPLPAAMVNDTRLLQVFQNLIGNALKYCERAPHVRISARREGDMCVFSVKDNGIGIAPENHERIFGLFQRLHSRDRYAGTGIGLATVKRIIESHGGRVWLESAVGQGSTFYFSLPAAAESPARPDSLPRAASKQ